MRWSTLLLVLLSQGLHSASSLNSLNVLLKCHLNVAFPVHSILNLYSPSPSLHAQPLPRFLVLPQNIPDTVHVLFIGLRFLCSNSNRSSLSTEIFVCLVLCQIPSTRYVLLLSAQ